MHSNATADGDESSASVSASKLAAPRYPGQNGAIGQMRQRPIAPRMRGGSLLSNSRRERAFPLSHFGEVCRNAPLDASRRPSTEAESEEGRTMEANRGQAVPRISYIAKCFARIATPDGQRNPVPSPLWQSGHLSGRQAPLAISPPGAGVIGRRYAICNDRCVPSHYRQQSRRTKKALRRIRGWR